MHADRIQIAHNHVHDLFYTAISCGWVWGYGPSVSQNNWIEHNHLHDIGQGLLSDMGGIYTLGVQPGTVIRGNWIHDIRSAHYGGWCIYPDEGSSHLLIEHNVCHDADRNAFHQHYGRENVIRNNIFAFGAEAGAAYTRAEGHRGFTFMRNIVVTDGAPIWRSAHGMELEATCMFAELNLFWDVASDEPHMLIGDRKRTLAQWRKLNHDRHSLAADPKFRNVAKRDLRLSSQSPAIRELGFEPIDLSKVGPRAVKERA